MKMIQQIAILFLFLLCPLGGIFAQSNIPRLVKKVMESVVTIVTYSNAGAMRAQGTGFILNPTGNIITNRHVLDGADSAQVKYHDGRIQTVQSIVGENRDYDILVITTTTKPAFNSGLTLSPSAPEIGEHIIVVGTPLGLDYTVSDGIVSALRTVPEFGDIIQISAPISPGSSGSPVINLKGEVIGVATFQYVAGQNLNFAIPSSQIMKAKEVHLRFPYSTSEAQSTISGDFDGDHKDEIAWIVGPKIDDTGLDCIGKCDCEVEFSTESIRALRLGDCIPGRLHNEGDLDGDGGDEISILPGWFTSAWRRIHLFSFKHNSWIELIEPFTIYIGDDFASKRMVPSRPGWIAIITDRWNDATTGIAHERREVKLR